MGEKIYGVDLSGKITPVMVRDAMIECFIKAHEEVLEDMKEYGEFESQKEFERMKRLEVEFLIKKFFIEVGGDFNNPTKESLVKVSDKLAEFAKSFRKPDIITRHYREIIKLVNKLE